MLSSWEVEVGSRLVLHIDSAEQQPRGNTGVVHRAKLANRWQNTMGGPSRLFGLHVGLSHDLFPVAKSASRLEQIPSRLAVHNAERI